MMDESNGEGIADGGRRWIEQKTKRWNGGEGRLRRVWACCYDEATAVHGDEEVFCRWERK